MSDPIDREAVLHKRRKTAMVSLLSQFERDIEPYLEGQRQAIDDFKRSCREKLNALTFEAIELLRMDDDEALNEHAVELAAQFAYTDTGAE